MSGSDCIVSKNPVNKIALGTAQFGMDYGINNERGRVSEEEVSEILDLAWKSGVDTIDTAYLYGKSERIIGCYKNVSKFKVVSKFPDIRKIEKYIEATLNNLKIHRIYGYLAHDFRNVKFNIECWKKILELKCEGKVLKVGFSLYYPYELEYLLDKNLNFDIVQVPYNIMDRRFEKYFSVLKEAGVELHVRSVFLQGLFFMGEKRIPPYFQKVKHKIKYIQNYALEKNVSVEYILLLFSISNEYIDKVVIGVDSKKQLEKNINSLYFYDEQILNDINLDLLKEEDESIIVPSNWRL